MLLATVKEEIEKQNDKQTQTITETISKTIEEQLLPIKKENEAMKSEILLLRLKVKYLELETRKNNVLLHGVEETENNNLELMSTVIELFNVPCTTEQAEEEKHDWDKWELSSIYRVGKMTEGKIRPIKISCTLTWRRNEILKKKKNGKKDSYPKNEGSQSIWKVCNNKEWQTNYTRQNGT
ncbi:unnamed protein product [Parnassius apollo]|uniref:(apollo) hypothetical protein n=1 Tax=Parnassius apollo TaxID=110799 RepID=A0A8S3XXJ6_PARAO|nr:unnamed protein product [Parnassius apollo]